MKLSIITPSYNQGEFIAQTFQSILDQDHRDFDLEYIVVDALSTDATLDVINEYTQKFLDAGIEFVFIHEKDNGQSDAINKGWSRASGDIVSFINSDDYYEPNVLSTVMENFSKHHDVQWLYGGWNLVDKNGKIYKAVQHQKYLKKRLLDRCNIGQPSCFIRKTLLAEFGMLEQDLHLAMDYDLWLRIASKYDPLVVQKIFSNMRYYADAKSGSLGKKQMYEMYKLSNRYSKPVSIQRLRQLFFLIAGLTVIFFNVDITKRIASRRAK